MAFQWKCKECGSEDNGAFDHQCRKCHAGYPLRNLTEPAEHYTTVIMGAGRWFETPEQAREFARVLLHDCDEVVIVRGPIEIIKRDRDVHYDSAVRHD